MSKQIQRLAKAKKNSSALYEYKGFEIFYTGHESIWNYVVMKIGEGWGDAFDTKKECIEAVDHWLNSKKK